MIFMKNLNFGEISWTANRASGSDFRRVFDLKIPWGPCVARNVQNFGAVTSADWMQLSSCIWTLRATQGPHGILRSKTIRKSSSWARFAPHEISPKIMNFHPASRTQNSTFLSSKIIVEDYPLGKLKSNYASDLGKIPKFLGEVKCLMNFPLLWGQGNG